ncbi:MAG: 2-oxoacid:acceptor oxidoreductase subunit alpha [candidate division Zixibacteria bacterium]|jgi:2-oxoglutarate ferredoxin oxidoreductase subunit alpha|nr:2-oxoacid:acceptor oxidoreductase subunit alpha [candidate division Zixibacteria bacterium]
MSERERKLLQGNQACLVGAIYAGMRFYAGYPITPSTEVAEGCARELPRIGGRFIQMEDEIASMAAIIGASVSGLKAMTATSGPGYSLMVENIGYAFMTETPVVIVNVQRGGPSTGLPTKVSQSDTMQARWGTHGDYVAIAVAPSTVADTVTETIRAFNLAERFRTPVTVLLDEVIAHSRSMVEIPQEGDYEIYERVRPTEPPGKTFEPFALTENMVSPMASYGQGYRFIITGLTHDTHGFTTNRADETKIKLDKLRYKITNFEEEIYKQEAHWTADAEIILIAYGSAARASLQAAQIAREAGAKIGVVQLYTIWPFPDRPLRDLCGHAKKVVVAELNMGQIVHEVRRALPDEIEVHAVQRYDGEILTPLQVLEKVDEVM